jgi:hypothetical protein
LTIPFPGRCPGLRNCRAFSAPSRLAFTAGLSASLPQGPRDPALPALRAVWHSRQASPQASPKGHVTPRFQRSEPSGIHDMPLRKPPPRATWPHPPAGCSRKRSRNPYGAGLRPLRPLRPAVGNWLGARGLKGRRGRPASHRPRFGRKGRSARTRRPPARGAATRLPHLSRTSPKAAAGRRISSRPAT